MSPVPTAALPQGPEARNSLKLLGRVTTTSWPRLRPRPRRPYELTLQDLPAFALAIRDSWLFLGCWALLRVLALLCSKNIIFPSVSAPSQPSSRLHDGFPRNSKPPLTPVPVLFSGGTISSNVCPSPFRCLGTLLIVLLSLERGLLKTDGTTLLLTALDE